MPVKQTGGSPQPSPLLSHVKRAMRLKTDAFNEELTGLIEACRTDLRIAGVKGSRAGSEGDPMVSLAVTLFCKAYFGNSKDSNKFLRSYELQKRILVLAGDYH